MWRVYEGPAPPADGSAFADTRWPRVTTNGVAWRSFALFSVGRFGTKEAVVAGHVAPMSQTNWFSPLKRIFITNKNAFQC